MHWNKISKSIKIFHIQQNITCTTRAHMYTISSSYSYNPSGKYVQMYSSTSTFSHIRVILFLRHKMNNTSNITLDYTLIRWSEKKTKLKVINLNFNNVIKRYKHQRLINIYIFSNRLIQMYENLDRLIVAATLFYIMRTTKKHIFYNTIDTLAIMRFKCTFIVVCTYNSPHHHVQHYIFYSC